jgi:hypothetical protein
VELAERAEARRPHEKLIAFRDRALLERRAQFGRQLFRCGHRLRAVIVLAHGLPGKGRVVGALAATTRTRVALVQGLGLNPRTFAMMVAGAASCSYLTPLEPSCLMVYGPGRYRFSDFLRVGGILTVIIFAIAILIVPRAWPLAGA